MKRPSRNRSGVLEKADGASRLKLSGVMVKVDVTHVTDDGDLIKNGAKQ